jgi:hypothetical protein
MWCYWPLKQRPSNQTETPFLFSRLLGRKAAVVEQADGTNILWVQSKMSAKMQKIGRQESKQDWIRANITAIWPRRRHRITVKQPFLCY